MQSGQSMFELVVALAVVTIILLSIAAVTSVSIRNVSFSKNTTLATRTAQETIEWLRGKRDGDWSEFSSRAQIPNWCLEVLDWDLAKAGNCAEGDKVGENNFAREVSFTVLDPDTVQAVVIVFWTDSKGYHEIKSSTRFTNWRNR